MADERAPPKFEQIQKRNGPPGEAGCQACSRQGLKGEHPSRCDDPWAMLTTPHRQIGSRPDQPDRPGIVSLSNQQYRLHFALGRDVRSPLLSDRALEEILTRSPLTPIRADGIRRSDGHKAVERGHPTTGDVAGTFLRNQHVHDHQILRKHAAGILESILAAAVRSVRGDTARRDRVETYDQMVASRGEGSPWKTAIARADAKPRLQRAQRNAPELTHRFRALGSPALLASCQGADNGITGSEERAAGRSGPWWMMTFSFEEGLILSPNTARPAGARALPRLFGYHPAEVTRSNASATAHRRVRPREVGGDGRSANAGHYYEAWQPTSRRARSLQQRSPTCGADVDSYSAILKTSTTPCSPGDLLVLD